MKSNGIPPPAERPVPCRAFQVLPEGGTRWRKALAGAVLRPESESVVIETLFDSVDHRLLHAGIELTVRGEAPRFECRLASLEPHAGGLPALEGTHVMERLPSFAWDFPQAQAVPLAQILETRALHAIGVHEADLARWAALDDQRKVVAWIDEERHLLREHASRPGKSVHRLLLRGLRGYDVEFERLAQPLEGASEILTRSAETFDPRALLGAPEMRSVPWPRLPPRVSARTGLARIVRCQLRILALNAPGLRAGGDAEYLHDTRVAVRRLRSLLGQLDGVLADEEQAFLGAELRWLAGCTGPARDLDTLLFEMRLSEPELRADLEPWITALAAERANLQRELVAMLDSERAVACVRQLRQAFAPRKGHAGPRAATPLALLLAKRLRRRTRQTFARAARVSAASPATELHELRICLKKLRYLLECCRGLVPKQELAEAFVHLKGLQAALGVVQDCEVQACRIEAFSQRVTEQPGPRAGLALGRFLERTLQRGRKACEDQAQRVAALLAPPGRKRFRALVDALRHSAGAPR